MIPEVNVASRPAHTGPRGSAAEKNNTKGVALQVQGKLMEAEACYRRAVSLKPGLAEAWSNLGAVLVVQHRAREAVACLERAIALRPTFTEAYGNLTQALTQEGRLADASTCWRRLLRLRPDDPDTLASLANALAMERKHIEAFEVYARTLALRPNHPKTVFALSLLHLQLGDFEHGLPLFEHRHEGVFGRPAHQFPQPVWRGQPLAGQRILLYHDQGLGDTLQFLRYLPVLEAAGAQIVLLIQPALRRLIGDAPPEVSAGDTFDLHCALPSLPLACGTTLGTIPATIPYLAVPEPERATAAAFSWPVDGLRVGLLWAGNPGHQRDFFRSLTVDVLEPLLRVERIHFFSLHLDRTPDPRIADLFLEPANMADAAAKMLHLDLVITVDTAIAHLAGALGLPVWIMLDYCSDWRWLLDRSDSPWYPTARLFRQERTGDWDGVMKDLAAALVALRDEEKTPSRVRLMPTPQSLASARVL